MGIVKKIVGGFKVVAGVVTGNPALVASGGADIATDFASKEGQEPTTSQPAKPTMAPVSPSPSVHFRSMGQGSHSLEERRGQNRERMSRIYKFPGTG